MNHLKSQQGVSLIEVIMLIIIVSVGTFSIGGIIANVVNISTRSLVLQKANGYAEIPLYRTMGFIENGDMFEIKNFLNKIRSEYDGMVTPDGFTYRIDILSQTNYTDNIITGNTFDEVNILRIQVTHELLTNPVTFELRLPAYQSDYQKFGVNP